MFFITRANVFPPRPYSVGMMRVLGLPQQEYFTDLNQAIGICDSLAKLISRECQVVRSDISGFSYIHTGDPTCVESG